MVWSVAACLLVLPWLAMQVTDQVVWDVVDFAVFAALLVGAVIARFRARGMARALFVGSARLFRIAARRKSSMVKTFAIVILVVGLLIPAGTSSAGDDPAGNATESGSTRMTVAEHDIYYLEIITADPRSVSEFYATAYGWRFEAEAPELGNALVATLPDGSLCGIRTPMHEQEKPIVRTYLRVADIDDAVKRAARLGATVALESMEIPGRGTVAIYFLGGIEQGLWQVP